MKSAYIIAEAGVNHNGSLEMAKKLIDAAAQAGADAVKFQTFKTEQLVNKNAPKADYQKRTTPGEQSQYDMLKRLELTEEAHMELFDYCMSKGIHFMSTPFDLVSLRFLTSQLDLPRLKISSGDLTNAPLLWNAARTKKPIIVSTGMATLAEIEQALGVLALGYTNGSVPPSINEFQAAYSSQEGQAALRDKVTLLHCTTDYPTEMDQVHLAVMDTLRMAFNTSVGYSDHTEGIAVSVAAVARGAEVIEKHFTLSRSLPGPDHQASLEPSELKLMVESIRQVEVALGSKIKIPTQVEIRNRSAARKSLICARAIKQGEIFTSEHLAVRRPGDGIAPIHYWDWIGRSAVKDYEQDEIIQ